MADLKDTTITGNLGVTSTITSGDFSAVDVSGFVTAVADGAISAGDKVVLQSDGKVKSISTISYYNMGAGTNNCFEGIAGNAHNYAWSSGNKRNWWIYTYLMAYPFRLEHTKQT